MQHAGRQARLRALGSLLLVFPACSTLRERFPTHEQVFKPVPLTIGQLRVEGTDSVYVLAGRGFELVAPSREILAEADRSIDAVGRAYVRYFGAEPRPIVVRMQLMRRDMSNAERDSAIRARRQAPRRDERGRPVVVIPVYALEDRRRGATPTGIAETPLYAFADPLVARAWVAAYADSVVTAADASGASPAAVARPEPLPDWLASGAAAALSSTPFQEFSVGWLSEHRKELIPLRTLFDSTRLTRHPLGAAAGRVPYDEAEAAEPEGVRLSPTMDGRMVRGDRRRTADVFSMQSLAVVQFLASREEPAVIGRLAARLSRGERPADALAAELRKLPRDLDALDAEFRTWIEEYGDRRRRGR
jgi:hypothetical protein